MILLLGIFVWNSNIETLPITHDLENLVELHNNELDVNTKFKILRQDIDNIAWTNHFKRVNENKTEYSCEIILIEGREHSLLLPVIQNIRTIFPEIPLHVIGTLQNQNILNEYKEKNVFQLTILNTNVFDVIDFNKLMVSSDFWINIASKEKVILTQIDAWFCDKPRMNIKDYFIYDYVGAPWFENQVGGVSSLVGNCGLCICSRNIFIDLCRNNSFDKFKKEHKTEAIDLFFSSKIHNKPCSVVAKAFSVENVFYDRPIGVHKPFFMDKGILNDLNKYCSGVDILSSY
jgi:hypothetical protein